MSSWFQIFLSLSQVKNKWKNRTIRPAGVRDRTRISIFVPNPELVFLPVKRFLFKMEAGLQNSLALSPSPQKHSQHFLFVKCCVFMFNTRCFLLLSHAKLTKNPRSVPRTPYHSQRIVLTVIQKGVGRTIDAQKWSDYKNWNFSHSQHLLTLFFFFIF